MNDAGFIDYQCPESPDELVVVDGGFWMSYARAQRLSCLMIATEKHRDLLLQEQQPPPSMGGTAVAILLGLALLTGFIIGKVVK